MKTIEEIEIIVSLNQDGKTYGATTKDRESFSFPRGTCAEQNMLAPGGFERRDGYWDVRGTCWAGGETPEAAVATLRAALTKERDAVLAFNTELEQKKAAAEKVTRELRIAARRARVLAALETDTDLFTRNSAGQIEKM